MTMMRRCKLHLLFCVATFIFVAVPTVVMLPLLTYLEPGFLARLDAATLAIALNYYRQSLFSGAEPTTNLVMAGALMSVIPVLIIYFLSQEQLIGGIASVGLKG